MRCVLKALALLLIAFLMLNLVATMLTCKAEVDEELIPHEDPARAHEETDILTLLMLYLYSLSFTSMEDYEEAENLLEQLKMLKVTEELRYVVGRFNELLIETHGHLNSTKKYIDLAKYFTSTSEFDEAIHAMHNAAFHLLKANISYGELEPSYGRLISVLRKEVSEEHLSMFYQLTIANRIYLGKIGELIKKYYEELIKLKMELSEVLPEEIIKGLLYEEIVGNVTQEIVFEGLYETKITIEAEPKVVMIGSNVMLHGKLSTLDSSEPLPWRKVFLNIVFKEKVLFKTTIITDANGVFTYNYTVPYIYDKDITVKGLLVIASYVPEGKDLGLYKPCSNITTVIALFNETLVYVKGPSIVYPGLKFKFTVNITPPPTEDKPRTVEVLIDRELQEVFETFSNETVYELKIPENISVGTHILTFKVNPLEALSPAIGSYSVLVTYIPVKFDLSVTKLLYYPFSKIKVWGKALIVNGTPLQNEEVLINIDGRSFNLNTSPYGEFSLEIDPTFTITFKEFTVNVEFKPKEPWLPKIMRREKVRVVSLIPLAFALVPLFFYMYAPPKEISLQRILGFFRRRRRRVVRKITEKPPTVSYPKLEVETYVKKPKVYSVEIVPTDVVELYAEAVKLISEKTLPPKPYETMREYWEKVQSKIPEHVSSAFKKLTILAERAIYFKPEFTSEELIIARKCYEEVSEWCIS